MKYLKIEDEKIELNSTNSKVDSNLISTINRMYRENESLDSIKKIVSNNLTNFRLFETDSDNFFNLTLIANGTKHSFNRRK